MKFVAHDALRARLQMPPHPPRKRFGQHFLRNPQVIEQLIAAIAPQPEQHLVEIGPGQLALTRPLLECGCQLDVIELDRDLIKLLDKQVSSFQQLTVHQADVLKFDFAPLVKNKQPLRIVGNLPYNISTGLLFHLFHHLNGIEDMTFMLQKEVVERIVATPATSSYGRLSVMLQYYCRAYPLFDVEPAAFHPPPKVNSSVVQLIPHRSPPVTVINQKHFAQLVALAFSQRRKTLRNTLKSMLDVPAIQSAGVDPQVRAETLTLMEFARLANEFSLSSQL